MDPTLRVAYLVDARVRDDRDAAGLTPAELKRVLAKLRALSPQWYPLVLTLALTGLRFGEASALLWSDIDFEARTLRVSRAQWKQRVGTPKTGSSRRVVALAPELVEVLRSLRRR